MNRLPTSLRATESRPTPLDTKTCNVNFCMREDRLTCCTLVIFDVLSTSRTPKPRRLPATPSARRQLFLFFLQNLSLRHREIGNAVLDRLITPACTYTCSQISCSLTFILRSVKNHARRSRRPDTIGVCGGMPSSWFRGEQTHQSIVAARPHGSAAF